MLSRDDKVIIKRFWRDWVLHYRSRLVLILALMVLVAATGGVYPALIRHVFDVLAGGAEQGTIDALAVTFVVSRVLFGIAYIADKGSLRSLIWAVGMACIVALFVTAA